MAAIGDANAKAVPGFDFRDWFISSLFIGIIRTMGLFPYRWRVSLTGQIVARVLGPVVGYTARVRDNLSLIFPDMPEAEKTRLARAVPEQLGRTVAELFSPQDMAVIATRTPVSGPGLAALDAAKDAGRPIILVSGHIGNYDVGRSVLIQRGHRVGALYRPMNLRVFNEFYVSRMAQVGTPLFLRGRRGMMEMVKFLKQGNVIALLIDQHMSAGAPLTFFGHKAWTALSAAELALRYDALLVPSYCIRQPDGLSFEMVVEAPIPKTDPARMTQALNDSLERQVRAHMEQWLWVHRRWKP